MTFQQRHCRPLSLFRVLGCSTIISACCATTTIAANSVIIESRDFGKGLKGAQIRVRIMNDVPLRGLVIPLSLVKTTPGPSQPFVTDVAMSFSERLSGSALSDVVVTNLYPERTSFCPSANNSLGYQNISYSTANEMHPVVSTPEGVLFVRMREFGSPLTAGVDTSGSIILTVNLTQELGTFEVDTTNTAPCNTVLFVAETESPYSLIKPAVIKGVIDIVCE